MQLIFPVSECALYNAPLYCIPLYFLDCQEWKIFIENWTSEIHDCVDMTRLENIKLRRKQNGEK